MVESTDTPMLARLSGITKAYPGVLANDSIDLAIEAGSIHALLGENGAGKSTLVKILYGLLGADSGSIEWQGQSVDIDSPKKARSLGIAMVFQHFSLFESLDVLENIALGMGVDANADLAARINDVSQRYGLPLDPARSVYSLSVGERQRIEIVRCLLQEPKLLVMDEPTSVLTPAEVDLLFVTLRRLAEEGVAILYISHKLEEIRSLCDTATILRGGRVVASARPSEESARSLAGLMMGEDSLAVTRQDHARASTSDQVERMRVSQVDLPGSATDDQPLVGIDFSVPAGSITGIAGVAGNGQDELLAVLSGEILAPQGKIVIDANDVTRAGAGRRRRLGLAVVPEERLGHGAVPDMSLADNALLTAIHGRGLARVGLLKRRAAKRFAQEIIDQFDVRCDGPGSLASSLSGGNLQKFVVGREVLQSPGVLIVSQPTWGVDAGAAAAIHAALRELASAGSAVLAISQDLDELMLISDQLGALCAGRLSAFYRTADLDVQRVGLLMGGATELEGMEPVR